MTAPQLAAQAILALLPTIPPGRPVEATIRTLTATYSGSTVVGVASVVVDFDAGPTPCRWLGAFAAEVVADTANRQWRGQRVLLVTTGDDPVVLGTINTDLDTPLPPTTPPPPGTPPPTTPPPPGSVYLTEDPPGSGLYLIGT